MRGLALYPKRMKWVEIFLMGSDLNRVVDHLHESRLFQIVDMESQREISPDSELLDMKNRIDKVIELLSPLEDGKKGLISAFFEERVEGMVIPQHDLRTHAWSWLKDAEREVTPLKNDLGGLDEDINYLRDIKERLVQLTGLDIDLDTISSFKIVRSRIGTTRRFAELKEALKHTGADLDGSLLDKKEGLHSVRILFSSSNSKEVENVLRGRLFTEVNLDIPRLRAFLVRTTGKGSDLGLPIISLIRRMEDIQDELEGRRDRVLEKGAELAPRLLPSARSWKEAVEIEIEKNRARGTFKRTRYTSSISGWVEKDRLGEMRDLLSHQTQGRYHLGSRDPTPEEVEENMVPTKLRNGRFASLFEPLTLTFSVPKYNEIDPSLWISVPFVLFFGLMLGDAGYGLLILLPSLYIYIKGKRSQTLRSIGALGVLMGLATTISGIWMGAFFGDLIPRLIYNTPGEPLYELTLLGYAMPYDTLKDPMVLFQISLWLGLAQLDLGILLLGYDRLKKKNIWGFFKGSVSWILIEIGAVIFIGALLVGWWELDTPLLIIGTSTLVSGTLLMAFEGGLMFLFDIEGLLGDWISYTRILALGLSTFGLAMAFNIVGEMLVDITPYLIPVVFILLFVLHIFNLLLQTLGAAVHSIRLQFVEFFGRFYEGGGELFDPFGREREFTRYSGESGSGGAVR